MCIRDRIIIGGLSLGMRSTAIPVIIVGVAVLISYFVSGGGDDFNMGLYLSLIHILTGGDFKVFLC